MAQDKKSIIVYADWMPQFEQLSDEEAGKLIKHFFRYVNDLNPDAPDRLTQIAFEPLKQSLKRDLKKWESIKEKRAEAGRKGGLKSAKTRNKASKTNTQKANEANASFVKQNQANEAVSVNDNVSVNDISTNVDNDNREIKNFSDDKNFEISENLKFNSTSWIESVAMQHKIQIEEIQKKIDEFVLFLRTTEKVHKSKREFISHFINWLPKKINQKEDGKEKQSGGSTKKQFRFSTSDAIETITRSS